MSTNYPNAGQVNLGHLLLTFRLGNSKKGCLIMIVWCCARNPGYTQIY